MSAEYVLPLADPQANLANVGGKGASLARLAAGGLPVPDGFHVTTAAYRELLAQNNLQPAIFAALEKADVERPSTLDAVSREIREVFSSASMPPAVAAAIAHAYASLPGANPAVAVRSSATAEDLPEASFAGQQDTFLNVYGLEAVLEATRKCWASLWTARAIGYRLKHDVDQSGVQLAVVVQLLVPAEAAGILFTADPISGNQDQAVISAAWGLGEAIVGGMVTPDAYTVNKPTGKVVKREIADKHVMTSRSDGGTRQEPVPDDLRRAPTLDDARAAELVRLGIRIEEIYGKPMDIEWTLSDGKLAIVQARPITTLPEPQYQPPTKWRLPQGAYAAMRNNIVELMADPLSPLFASLGRRAINASMRRLMDESLAMRGVMPEEPIITVNHYAYYNGSLSLKSVLRVLVGSVRIMRAMFTGAVERWTEDGRPRYYRTVQEWEAKDWARFSSTQLVDGAHQLTKTAIDAYLSLVSGVIPAAWITEGLFTVAYKRLIKRRQDPVASTYLLGFDSLPIRADKSLYELALWAREEPPLRDCLSRTSAVQLAASLARGAPPADVPPGTWQECQQRFQSHIEAYGHTFYSLDFADPVPADDPAPVLEALRLYVRGQGADPRARQLELEKRREQATAATTGRLKGWRRNLFVKYLGRAQKYAPLREDGLAEVGLAYPLIRQMLRELGHRLTERQILASPDDVYWLTEEEVRSAAGQLDAGLPTESLKDRIPRRMAEVQAARQVSPPRALPSIGIRAPGRKPGARRDRPGEVIKGAACSPGRVTGPARVLHGPQDFGQMTPGDVLVAPITTPAWTPLFAMASAVVTDIGGPLSHGSIVAREYAIPAVLGTGTATARIRSGQAVTVDGSAGTVTLEAEPRAAAPRAMDPAGPIEWRRPDPKGVYMRGSVVDLMPDPLSPLFATLGIGALIEQMTPMARRVTRSEPMLPDDYYTTINNYGYANTNLPARSWWWMLSRLIPAYPRMLRSVVRMWRDEMRPEYLAAVARERAKPAGEMTLGELWRKTQDIVAAAMQYVVALLFATMGASAGSELLLTNVYNKMVKRDADPDAPVLLMGWNNIPVQSEKSLYDLAMWCRDRKGLADALLNTSSRDLMERLETQPAPSSVDPADWAELHRHFHQHLERFGHIVFQLDFAEPLPLDNPAPMLEVVKLYLRGEGANPHERQRAGEEKRVKTAAEALGRLRGLKRWAFRVALGWGQSLAEVREDALAEIGLGYPLIRERLHELGRRFADAGVIRAADDIYFLEKSEIDDCVAHLEGGAASRDLSDQVEARRAFLKKVAQVTPPPMIPVKKRVMGVKTDVFVAASEDTQTGNLLKGVPTSGGRVTAPACVLRGPEDFDQMKPGGVLVAGTTTPAWTPLFAMASAVVTDIGGPLSHGSIVAREYGIPAVMGTGVATRRIQTGQIITVDGSAGTVTLSGDQA
jgi:pyruvate,water dikinase